MQPATSMPEPQTHARQRPLYLLLAGVLGLAPLAASAQVYRSVDDQGQVTFSDTPPAGAVAVEPVEIAPGPSAAQVQASQERFEAERATLEALAEAREAERERAHAARMQRLQEEVLRAAINPPRPQPVAPEPRHLGYYDYGTSIYPGYPHFPGYPVLPHPRPPFHVPAPLHPRPPFHVQVPPPRPKVLDSPLYNKRISPVYR